MKENNCVLVKEEEFKKPTMNKNTSGWKIKETYNCDFGEYKIVKAKLF